MNIVSRLGIWIEKHFPERMTAQDVAALVKADNLIIHEKIAILSYLAEDIKKIKEELAIIKTQSLVRSRIAAGSVDNMTPFAQRLPPVQPHPTHVIAGGNK